MIAGIFRDFDRKADLAVYRPSNGITSLLKSAEGFGALQFGTATDVPLPNAFVPYDLGICAIEVAAQTASVCVVSFFQAKIHAVNVESTVPHPTSRL
ncbi:MAG TPA: hypothetical protein PKO33_05030 [Pyrinomonadaceae bacterium]|nr:hypothetical protein [Pyrinomonadaceae bacterium]